MNGIFAHWPNRITAMRFGGASILFLIFSLSGDLDLGDHFELFSISVPMQDVIMVCFFMFVVLAVTDVLDGYLARSGGHVSVFGRIADPFVDKVLIVGTLTFLSVMPWSRDRIPAWFVVITLAREFLVTGLRGYVESIGKEFSADKFGKAKMLVQCIAVGGVMFIPSFNWPDNWLSVWVPMETFLIGVTLVLTVGSGFSYVNRTRKLLSEDKS
ncbi:MAG: CDP-diacylglycerol--glycerol-3-phosphate 3-phosphatidyltransferase [Planctomycetota bacterium]